MANKTIPAIQTNEGNVGIGTTNPAFRLDVTNSITSRSTLNSPRFSSAGTYVYGVTNFYKCIYINKGRFLHYANAFLFN